MTYKPKLRTFLFVLNELWWGKEKVLAYLTSTKLPWNAIAVHPSITIFIFARLCLKSNITLPFKSKTDLVLDSRVITCLELQFYRGAASAHTSPPTIDQIQTFMAASLQTLQKGTSKFLNNPLSSKMDFMPNATCPSSSQFNKFSDTTVAYISSLPARGSFRGLLD